MISVLPLVAAGVPAVAGVNKKQCHSAIIQYTTSYCGNSGNDFLFILDL